MADGLGPDGVVLPRAGCRPYGLQRLLDTVLTNLALTVRRKPCRGSLSGNEQSVEAVVGEDCLQRVTVEETKNSHVLRADDEGVVHQASGEDSLVSMTSAMSAIRGQTWCRGLEPWEPRWSSCYP